MKTTPLVLVLLLVLPLACKHPSEENKRSPNVITSDVSNFWEAYDHITTTQDSALQYQFLDSLYFQRGTDGLKGIREARSYSTEEYLHAINNYPEFWNSIRGNFSEIPKVEADLEQGIQKLKDLYPELKPAKIYFTVGAFRTGGTTLDSLVLIGSEISLADSTTITHEFPENLSHLKTHFATNPNKHLVFLNVHEYVHTQQKPRVFNLLSLALYEGVAEFVASKALGVASPNPQISFGKENAESIRSAFEREMYYPNNRYKWLDGNDPNEFGMRDLGYAVGYQICEKFYAQAEDKKEALKTLITLNYEEEAAVEDVITKSNYFSASLDTLYQAFERKRPTVIGIKQFRNNSMDVDPKTQAITIQFSEALTGHHTGVDFGDLGAEAFPKNDVHGRFWGAANKSWTIPVTLEPNKMYQILISDNFRTSEGIPIKPYLIEFKTAHH